MVRYSFVLHEMVDAPHLLQSKHHFGYKLLLYSTYGAAPRCIAKLASAHFVPGQGWVTRINLSKFCYYVVRGASFSSKSYHGFPVLFLILLRRLVKAAKVRLVSGMSFVRRLRRLQRGSKRFIFWRMTPIWRLEWRFQPPRYPVKMFRIGFPYHFLKPIAAHKQDI